MPYADSAYYNDDYKGATLPADELEKLLVRASDDVDAATGYSFIYADLHEFRQGLVKKAVCAQVEWYGLNGEAYNDAAAESENIGKYSYKKGSGRTRTAYAPRMLQYIEQAGVMNRAIPRGEDLYCE